MDRRTSSPGPTATSGEAFRTPVLLPGGRTVLFSIYRGAASGLAAVDLRTGAITRFEQPGFGPQWVDGGFVVLGNADGTLIALPFDPEQVRPTGPPVTIARDVSQPDPYSTRAAVSASWIDRLSAVRRRCAAAIDAGVARGTGDPAHTRARRGMRTRASPPTAGVSRSTSPTRSFRSRDVWVLDVGQRVWSRLTTNGISDKPIWTPDGRRVVYSSNDDLWWIGGRWERPPG